MKHITLVLILTLAIAGCMNKVEVPAEVKLKAPTEPIRIVHEVALSTQITDFISSDCAKIATDSAFTPGTPEYDAYITDCTSSKLNEVVSNLTAIINGSNDSNVPNMQLNGN